MSKKPIKSFEVGDIIEDEAFKRMMEATNRMLAEAKTEAEKLPKPTHDPYAGPYTVYSIELEDPSLTILPPEPPRRKLH